MPRPMMPPNSTLPAAIALYARQACRRPGVHWAVHETATLFLLFGRVMLAGVCTVRVPTAGDWSWQSAPGTPGVFTETCCSVPLTMVEEPAKRIGIAQHIAAVTRCIGQAPPCFGPFWLKIYREQSDGGSIVLYPTGERRAGAVLGGPGFDRLSRLGARPPCQRRDGGLRLQASGTGSSSIAGNRVRERDRARASPPGHHASAQIM